MLDLLGPRTILFPVFGQCSSVVLAALASLLLVCHPDNYPWISIPMDRAVPSTVLIAASSDAAFRSGIFVLAISSTCLRVTFPTLFLLGTPEPFWMPAALNRSTAAGGVFVTNVNERSDNTVMTTGMISPCCPWVRALNVLQNSMMFTPCWPSAGPTGGAGVA